MNKTIVACSLSKCVHVWGVHHFLRLARDLGFKTIFLGPALKPEEIIQKIRLYRPDFVAVGYRLTPETGKAAIREFIKSVQAANFDFEVRYTLGGTTPVAQLARPFQFFDAIFDGNSQKEDIIRYLKQIKDEPRGANAEALKDLNMVDRWRKKRPYPLLRHHFGRPTVGDTIRGVEEIAKAEVLDVICLGTDQDAQENFFNPELQTPSQKGAGGVPVRAEADLVRIYAASRCGNYPLLRTYCGTRNLIELADIFHRTINICSTGVPIFWYNQLDGRGPMGLEESIQTHQQCIAWHGVRDIPVEILDPHQWAMRGAHDVIFVASSFISASICKKLGVKYHIAQLMFNTPGEASFKMDLAKILASLEMITPLEDDNFKIFRMPRAGLLSFPPDEEAAKGHLASSTMLQMAVQPDLINVVAYCEANRATTTKELIESCKIVRKVVSNAIENPFPDVKFDPEVIQRKNHLVKETKILLGAIKELAGRMEKNWLNPAVLGRAVRTGILDTPQFMPWFIAPGQLLTRLVNGAMEAIHPQTHQVVSEAERLELLKTYRKEDSLA
ncbi:MAG: hypothetical protein J5I98_05980 [Phaeodactylibacter sp.]|nr:hypothetical protein [Phaeodactylibacter sp.]